MAYPPLPPDDSGANGTGDVLRSLASELRMRGHQVDVAACPGMTGTGLLNEAGLAPECACGHACARAGEHDERVLAACARGRYDVVLDHSGHFFRHAARVEGYVLSTLHRPRESYDADLFLNPPPNLYFNCISEGQRDAFRDLPRMMPVVHNGVEVRRLEMGRRRAGYVLWLGSVSRASAPELAIAAAEQAKLPLLLAGRIGPAAADKAHWTTEVKPSVDHERVRWAEDPLPEERIRFLREARALLVTSRAPEVSARTALEAMACGTPVIGFPSGALREVVTPETGFLVNDVQEMAAACHDLRNIRSLDCRMWVHQHYSITAMAEGYEILVQELEEQKMRLERRME